jgi:hypothetical protein
MRRDLVRRVQAVAVEKDHRERDIVVLVGIGLEVIEQEPGCDGLPDAGLPVETMTDDSSAARLSSYNSYL